MIRNGGSWAWVNNRIFREALTTRGGIVVAERYLSVGDIEFDQVISAILDQRPDFVFNNLIGTSAYAFFRAFRAACGALGINQAAEIPVASCTLSEPELAEIGADAVDGQVHLIGNETCLAHRVLPLPARRRL
jgi:ABC-type branched-subunit amino acid transport system substrate-binding protein